jgi:Protein of unknown function (DUF1761)
MFNVLGDVNWLAIVLATLACTVLGGLWFAVLFSKQYADALGRDPAQKLEMTPLSYIGPMLCSLVTVFTSAVLIQALHIETMKDGLSFGAIVGFGYLVSTMVTVAINPNFPRPLSYAAINGPFFFISSLITSVILVAMN